MLQFDESGIPFVRFIVTNVIKQQKERYSSMKKVLVVAAVVAFGLAAFGVTVSWVAFVPLGLALWAGSELLGSTK